MSPCALSGLGASLRQAAAIRRIAIAARTWIRKHAVWLQEAKHVAASGVCWLLRKRCRNPHIWRWINPSGDVCRASCSPASGLGSKHVGTLALPSSSCLYHCLLVSLPPSLSPGQTWEFPKVRDLPYRLGCGILPLCSPNRWIPNLRKLPSVGRVAPKDPDLSTMADGPSQQKTNSSWGFGEFGGGFRVEMLGCSGEGMSGFRVGIGFVARSELSCA